MKTKIYPIVYPNSLRKYRKAAGLRQLDVARLMGLEGSTERISKWENGAADPNINNLFRLAKVLNVAPQELYPEIWQPTPHPLSSATEAVSKAGIQVEE